MTYKAKVSVIIPTKNPGVIFRRVLSSVCLQKTAFLFDILVIDSGSTDGTLEYVKSVTDTRVRLHQIAPSEFGHGRTRNLAVSLTSSQYVAMITHDACPTSDMWLANLVNVADRDVRIAGVFGRHIAHPGASLFTTRELEMHFEGFEANPIVSLDDPLRYAADAGYRQYLHFFSDNNALIRRAVWEDIPYPDVNFAEDQIWAQKIIEAGWHKAYASDAAVFHSHDYALIERLQRSFDESYAFLCLFGYQLCPDLRAMIRSWAALTIRDFYFARTAGLWRQSPLAVAAVPFDNLMRVLGHYLGARGDRMTPATRRRLSRDYRIHTG